jgi:hypothetical protein
VGRCTWTLGTSGVAALLGDLWMVIRDFQGGFGSIPREFGNDRRAEPKNRASPTRNPFANKQLPWL